MRPIAMLTGALAALLLVSPADATTHNKRFGLFYPLK